MVIKNVELILKQRKLTEWQELFWNYDLFHIAHFWQDLWFDAMWTKPTQNALKKQAWKMDYNFFDAEDIYPDRLKVWKMKLEKYYNQFINNKQSAMLITEWHWSSESFSVLQKYKKRDKLWINSLWSEQIDISPKKLADIVIKRQKIKNQENIKEPDFILFAACKWDYALNFFRELDIRENELWDNFIPPIMMTAAEAWQNSQFSHENLETEIPYMIFKHALNIWSKEKTTFWTFFKNSTYDKKVWSDPSMFYPVKINWKWVPQQLW
jgi:hypothetical protein